MSENQNREIVKMEHIVKTFGGVHALSDVHFSANAGEVHALLGENGAGKSTLVKILAGALEKDSGEVFIDGKSIHIHSPKDGQDAGISVIYQEFALAKDLTVAENVFIDNMGEGKHIIDWKRLKSRTSEILDELGFGDIDVSKKVEELTVAYQQVVEICKAISRDAKVLIFDEPTAVLTSREVEKLFTIIERLKSKGVCIIYISHRLEEIFKITDRITVLKDGANVTCMPTSDTDKQKLVTCMIGRDMSEFFPERNAKIGDVILKVNDLNNGKMTRNVSFEARAGEVLGFAGLVGAGRTETMRTIFGADKKDSGVVYLNGKEAHIRSPKIAVKHGIGMVPEDRKQMGILLDMSIRVNGTLSSLGEFATGLGVIKAKKETSKIDEMIETLTVKTPSQKNKASSLSGGNQQKVALMKWLISECSVLIFDEPTRGVDVGAKVEIYKVINSLAEQGVAIIMISSEMPEIIGMCDRVVVMRNGSITGEVEGDDITEQSLINLSMGVA
ncbi:MAG: sugar ABC transporter ATP-binding protein [Clostridiales Family XIII bacterium]|jgi:ribose transport system ATP-binding protein|nr:sugar ABC transporter ATP-binding protein [Clostridiales Family XIII bacterium]